MKRLLWKELCRTWSLCLWLTGCYLILLLLKHQGLMLAIGQVNNPWSYVPILVAVLYSFSAYSEEADSDRAQYIHALPVTWQQLLWAKLLMAYGAILVSVILATVMLWAFLGQDYAAFLTVPVLAFGAAKSSMVLSFFYTAGVACSAAMPGLTGGLMMSALSYGIMVVPASAWLANTYGWAPWVVGVVGLMSVLIAGVAVVRYGVARPIRAKLGQYSLWCGISFVLGIASWSYCSGYVTPFEPPFLTYSDSMISPDGRYALVREAVPRHPLEDILADFNDDDFSSIDYRESGVLYLVRLSDMKKVRINTRRPCVPPDELSSWFSIRETPLYEFGWSRKGIAFAPVWAPVSGNHSALWIGRMDSKGKLQDSMLEMPLPRNLYNGDSIVNLSPDGKVVMFASKCFPHKDNMRDARFVDLEQRRALVTKIHSARDLKWTSNSEISYTDRKGKKQVVSLR